MKFVNVAKRYGAKLAVPGLLLAPMFARAQSSDPYSSITSAANWTTVGTDIVVVFAALAAVFVIFKGGKILLKAVGGR